jgi:hypothetical protein
VPSALEAEVEGDGTRSVPTTNDCVALILLDEVDRLQADYLVTRLQPKAWPAEVRRKIEEGKDFCNVAKAIEQIETLIAPLRTRPQLLALWSKPIVEVLQKVYADHGSDLHTLAALEKITKCLQAQTLLPEPLDPKLSADEAIAWTLDQLRSEMIPPPASDEAVELLGWLELPLDDAAALIVTTFNEGFTPESTSGDSFLPNSLRKSLGLLDNDRRYARDAYAVSAILASRESVHLISARRDAEGNPLVPSRLLFAAEENQVVARAREFFQPLSQSPVRTPLVGAGLPPLDKSRLYVPRPQEVAVPSRLKVTQFRDYLACPYRFYLRHLLGLKAMDDTCEELAANAFGNLLHKVLERFGANKKIRDSANEEDIFEFLRDELKKSVGLRYGDKDRLAAVEIQIEQIRARLEKFAAWQAEHRAEGWRIVYAERTKDELAERDTEPLEPDAEVIVDDVPFFLGGRIDRIDQHEDGDRLKIFDYKTGDRVEHPERTHRRRQEWVDLQLPLYRHLAEAWGFEGEMQLGYIRIPKAAEEIGEALADWSEADLASADETMREVVRRIRRRQFWEPGPAPAYDDDFTALCQDRRLGGRLYEELEAAAAAPAEEVRR